MFQVKAHLDAEGEYSSELEIVHDQFRDVVKLNVTRASRDLGVEFLTVDPARAQANVMGASEASMRVVIAEKAGREVAVNTVLTRFGRKQPEGSLIQSHTTMRVTPEKAGAAGPDGGILLKPADSLGLQVVLTGLHDSGEYQGRLRLTAPGAKPVDQDFTVTLRESPWVAFWIILIGVTISAVLRAVSQNLRPRLLQIQRAQLLIRDLDILIAEPGREAEELELLRVLRRQGAVFLVGLDANVSQDTQARLGNLEKRVALARSWITLRRRVNAVTLPKVRDKLRPAIERIRSVILSENSSDADLAAARKDLDDLDREIDQAVREELKSQVDQLRSALHQSESSGANVSEARVNAEIGKLLNAAEAALATDLPAALRSYSEARAKWLRSQIERLARRLTGAAPAGMTMESWRTESSAIERQVTLARRQINTDVEGANETYQAAVAAYTTVVCEALTKDLAEARVKAKGLDGDEKVAALAELDKVQAKIAAARDAIASGDTGEAIRRVDEALAARQASLESQPQTRSFIQDAVTNWLLGVAPVPGVVGDVGSGVVVTDREIKLTARMISGVDVMSWVVAILVATLLGIVALWSPKATWGGWEDHIVALLWGLGLHQFTFAGVSALSDKLTGAKSEPAS